MRRITGVLLGFALMLNAAVIPASASSADAWDNNLSFSVVAGEESYEGVYFFDYDFTVSGGSERIFDIGYLVDDASAIDGMGVQVLISKYELGEYLYPEAHVIQTFNAGYKLHNGRHFVGALGIDLTLEPGVYQFYMTPKSSLYGIYADFTCTPYSYSKTGRLGFMADENLLLPMVVGIAAGYTYSELAADYVKAKALVEKARADEERRQREALANKPITLKIDGRVIPTDVPPVIESGRTLVPVRAFVEALGYVVSWDSVTQIVDIYEFETQALRISLRMNSNKARVATSIYDVTTEVIMEVSAKNINGRIMVPVRFIAETLGCKVGWDAAARTISITSARG